MKLNPSASYRLLFVGIFLLPTMAIANEQRKPQELPKDLLQFLLEFSDDDGTLVDPAAIDAVMQTADIAPQQHNDVPSAKVEETP